MNDFFNEIADYLDSGIAALTMSTNLFVGALPKDPADAVGLFGLPGVSIGQGRDIKDMKFPRFQVIIRNTDYEAGSDIHAAVRNRLHGMINVSLPHHRVLRCHAESEGGPVGQDAQGRFEFAINFAAEEHDV